jgi:hypothetical protein
MVDMINIDDSLDWVHELLYAENRVLCNSLSHLVVGIEHRSTYPNFIDEEHEEVVTWR